MVLILIYLIYLNEYTPLNLAVLNDRCDIINFFCDNSVDINRQDSYGRSPLHLACRDGSLNSVITLLRRGADYKLKTSKTFLQQNTHFFAGATPVHYAKCGLSKIKNLDYDKIIDILSSEDIIQAVIGKPLQKIITQRLVYYCNRNPCYNNLSFLKTLQRELYVHKS